MAKHFRPWNPKQKWLLPPEITEFIPEGHASHFVRDLVVEQLDLSEILDTYEEERGYPPFHPAMMKDRKNRKDDDQDPPAAVKPEPGAQRNFTDPESRIMPTKNGFEQCYNAQAGVDAKAHVIVACGVVNTSADCPQLLAMVDQVRANLGRKPRVLSADTGYCSEANLEGLETRKIKAYIATGRQKHGTKAAINARNGKHAPRIAQMREKLKRGGWRSPYRLRKQVVEPIFGQIKQAMGFRQFLMRGLAKMQAEWHLVCTAHNLLKLARAQVI